MKMTKATGKQTKAAQAKEDAVAPKSVHTPDKIVDAASHLFANQGYANSTLDDVARCAGFTKGAVYYYFKDKESLLLEVLRRIESRSIDATTAAVRRIRGSAARQLETFVVCQTRWAGRYPEDLAVMMHMSAEAAHTSRKLRAQVLRFYDKLAAALAEIIDAGKSSREFNAAQDTRDTVLYLQAVHDGNMMVWYRSGTNPELGRRISRVTLAGFMQAVQKVSA